MRIKFSAYLDHQIEAIEAVTDLFEGQPRNEIAPIFTSLTTSGIAAVSNQLDLDEAALLANLQSVQERSFVDSQGNSLRRPGALSQDKPYKPNPYKFLRHFLVHNTGLEPAT